MLIKLTAVVNCKNLNEACKFQSFSYFFQCCVLLEYCKIQECFHTAFYIVMLLLDGLIFIKIRLIQ